MLEKTLESPLNCKEIQKGHSKGNQSWIFIRRTDAKAETPILWPLDVKNWLIWKDPDAGQDWRQEEKGTTADEMSGWHHWLNGHEFEWTPLVGYGQEGLAYWFMGSQIVRHDWATEVTSRKKTIKNTNTWRLNNMLLNNQKITEKFKKEIKICIGSNENEITATQNLWDSVKQC